MKSKEKTYRHRCRLELHPLGKTIEVEAGTDLRTVLHPYGVEFPCGGRGRCAACRVKMLRGNLAATPEQAGILPAAEIEDGWRLACRCTVDGDAAIEIGQWETVILADHSSFAFTPRSGLGAAIDLGTTTIVAQLLDFETGHVLGVRADVNPQAIHGSDVMNRIHAALAEGKREEMVIQTRRAIATLLGKLLRGAGLAGPRLDAIVLAGNTVMHHVFCGLDLEPLSRTPFESPSGGLQTFRASELGWALAGDPPVHFLPCLGSFVGSDILCGILATKMHERDGPAILVDLGTNGEIVVGDRRRILCASTAAGPAFEGGRISRGMRATTGAISEVWAENGRLRCRVIGDAAPRGLCGSGLVDAVATALDLGLIEPSGRLTGGKKQIDLAAPVNLLQSDIRELQLAKGAIAAGIRILRRRFGGAARGAIPVYLAGAFGNYVNKGSARMIGLIPAEEHQIEPAGNTALLGAKMVLFSHLETADFADLRTRIEHVSLAADPAFQETFIEETAFPPAAVPSRRD